MHQNDFPTIDDGGNDDMTAVDYFELFFDDVLIEKIIDESSDYCLSKNCPDIQLSKNELKGFLLL